MVKGGQVWNLGGRRSAMGRGMKAGERVSGRDGGWASESGLNPRTLGSHFLSCFSLTLSD